MRFNIRESVLQTLNERSKQMSSIIPWFNKTPGTVSDSSITEFKKEVDALFNNFFGGVWTPSSIGAAKGFIPAFDVKENEEEVLVSAELPGVRASDIEVNLTGDTLLIKGEKKEEKEEKTENRHTIERSYGSFTRSVKLPCEVLQDQIEANFKNGVLQLKLPKAQHEKKTVHKIEVKQS